MVRQCFLDAGHAPFLPTSLDDETIGRADENEEHCDPHRGDDDRLDQSRLVGYRGDVTKAGGSDRNHREIDHVEEARMAVVMVDQAIAVEPVDQHHQKYQRRRQPKADAQITPHRDLDRAAPPPEARAAHGPDARSPSEAVLPPAHAAPRSISRQSAPPARRARNNASGRGGAASPKHSPRRSLRDRFRGRAYARSDRARTRNSDSRADRALRPPNRENNRGSPAA